MTLRHSLRYAIIMCASLLVLCGVPTTASAATTVTLDMFEGAGGGPYDNDGTLNAFYSGTIQNTGGEDTNLIGFRVGFDPRELQWDAGSDSRFYFDNGTPAETVDDDPMGGGRCTVFASSVSEVVYECALTPLVFQSGADGSVQLTALRPADGLDYTVADIDFTLVTDNAPDATDMVTSSWNDNNSNLQIVGGYVGDPDLIDRNFTGEYRDFDGESTGVKYGAGDVMTYRFLLQNPTHLTDPTGVAHGVEVRFEIPTDAANDYEMAFQPGDVTVTGGLSSPSCTMTFDGGDFQNWSCSFTGAVAVNGSATITLPVRFIDAIDESRGFNFLTANSTIDGLDQPEELTFASADSCQLPRFFGSNSPGGAPHELVRYQMHGTASITAIESGAPIRYVLPCVEPDAPQTSYNPTTGAWNPTDGYDNSNHTGIFRGPANASYAWLNNEAVAPGPGNAYAFTWEGTGLTGVAPDDVLDTAAIAAPPLAGGNHYRVMFHVRAEQQANLGATLTGPASLAVAAGGTNATYTATVTNAGPDSATSSRVKVQLPAGATYVSSSGGTGSDACSVAGQLVTCTIANLANGASRQFAIVAKYQPGAALTLPSTANVTATAELLGAGAKDPASSNNSATAATSLTASAVCSAGQTGTPPNCVTPPAATCPEGTAGTPPKCDKPARITGGAANQTFTGGAANDVFRGGKGSETFYSSGGNDRASGGAGNDRLYGSWGNDTFSGGTGNDRIYGGAGNDKLRGDAGNDVVDGGKGIDDTRGGSGNDRVTCGAGGRETAHGDAGNDVVACIDGLGGDTVNGGAGDDVCFGDVGDRFIGCESIVRVATAKSLLRSLPLL